MDLSVILDLVSSIGFPGAIAIGLLKYSKQNINKTIEGYEERAKEYKKDALKREQIIREDGLKREELILGHLREYKSTCDKLNKTNQEVAKTNRILAEEMKKELVSSNNIIGNIQVDIRLLDEKIDKLTGEK